MTKQELQQLHELVQKLAEKRKKYEKKQLFQKVLESLKTVPTVQGRLVQPTANDYFGRSWERGLKVSYKKDNTWHLLKHRATVRYENHFPHRTWKEETDKTIAEQLFELFVEQKIDYNTEIKFEFIDWEYKTYDKTKELIVPLSKIFPEVLKIIENNLPSEE